LGGATKGALSPRASKNKGGGVRGERKGGRRSGGGLGERKARDQH